MLKYLTHQMNTGEFVKITQLFSNTNSSADLPKEPSIYLHS